MIKTTLVALMSLLALPVLAGDTPSRPDLLREGASSLRDALEDARDGGYACRKSIATDLADIVDDLRDGPNHKRLGRLVNDLDEIQREAKRVCPRGVNRDIADALDELNKALDMPDSGTSRSVRSDPNLPECWNDKDPACHQKRNGEYPVEKKGFFLLMKLVESQTGAMGKEDTLKSAVKGHYFTVSQLAVLIEMMAGDLTKADVVKAAAPHVVDYKNAVFIKKVFRNSISGQEAVAAIERASPRY